MKFYKLNYRIYYKKKNTLHPPPCKLIINGACLQNPAISDINHSPCLILIMLSVKRLLDSYDFITCDFIAYFITYAYNVDSYFLCFAETANRKTYPLGWKKKMPVV